MISRAEASHRRDTGSFTFEMQSRSNADHWWSSINRRRRRSVSIAKPKKMAKQPSNFSSFHRRRRRSNVSNVEDLFPLLSRPQFFTFLISTRSG